jgi:hypothetical protein
MNTPITSGRTPVHLWIVGVLATLWNAFGCVDYFMTQTRNAAYLKSFTPEQIAYFDAFPAWADGAWAIAVWGALLGAILLLLRRRLAVAVFLVAVLAMIVAFAYQLLLAANRPPLTVGAAAFTALLFAAEIGLLIYARRMRASGVLR